MIQIISIVATTPPQKGDIKKAHTKQIQKYKKDLENQKSPMFFNIIKGRLFPGRPLLPHPPTTKTDSTPGFTKGQVVGKVTDSGGRYGGCCCFFFCVCFFGCCLETQKNTWIRYHRFRWKRYEELYTYWIEYLYNFKSLIIINQLRTERGCDNLLTIR